MIERAGGAATETRGPLAPFADVVLAHATVLSPHRRPARRYPGARTDSSPAAAKLRLIVSALGCRVERVRLDA